MTNKNPYTMTGFGLLLAGSLFTLSGYFLFNAVWLTALGICLLILAAILLALGKAVPRLPPEVCRLLLETGIDNIAALLEELGVKSKAIYLPSSLAGERPRAFVPLHANGKNPVISRALPKRLIARYGAGPEDIGLLISTIGSAAAGLLETRPGATPGELEAALTSLFSGRLGLADRAGVTGVDNLIKVEIFNPRLENSPSWSHHCLGSPLAAIAASIAAEAFERPVSIRREERDHGKYNIELEVGV